MLVVTLHEVISFLLSQVFRKRSLDATSHSGNSDLNSVSCIHQNDVESKKSHACYDKTLEKCLYNFTVQLLECEDVQCLGTLIKNSLHNVVTNVICGSLFFLADDDSGVYTADSNGNHLCDPCPDCIRNVLVSGSPSLLDAQCVPPSLAQHLPALTTSLQPLKVGCFPVQDRKTGSVLAVLVIAGPSVSEGTLADIQIPLKQIAACYSHIQRTFQSQRSNEERVSQQLIRLCGELCDQDAAQLQLKVIRYLEEETQAEFAFLLLVVPETQELFCQVVGKKVLQDEIRFPGHSSSFSAALETKQPLSLDDVPKEKIRGIEELVDTSVHSLLCVPVTSRSDNSLIALACLVNKHSGHRFTEKDISTIRQCFRYTATVLTSTLAFQNERKLKVQTQALLKVARHLFTNLAFLHETFGNGLEIFPYIKMRDTVINVGDDKNILNQIVNPEEYYWPIKRLCSTLASDVSGHVKCEVNRGNGLDGEAEGFENSETSVAGQTDRTDDSMRLDPYIWDDEMLTHVEVKDHFYDDESKSADYKVMKYLENPSTELLKCAKNSIKRLESQAEDRKLNGKPNVDEEEQSIINGSGIEDEIFAQVSITSDDHELVTSCFDPERTASQYSLLSYVTASSDGGVDSMDTDFESETDGQDVSQSCSYVSLNEKFYDSVSAQSKNEESAEDKTAGPVVNTDNDSEKAMQMGNHSLRPVLVTVSKVNLSDMQVTGANCATFSLDDLTKLLREIMQQARNLTNAERCSVFLIDHETEELVAKVFDGISAKKDNEVQEEIRLPITQGIAGKVATSGELLNIQDAYAHPLFYRAIDDSTGFRTRNILCFPIKDEKGRILGVAQLCNKKNGDGFTQFDEEIATAFGIYCAISISHSLMYKKLLDTQHRKSLANELMIYYMQVSPDDVQGLSTCDIPHPRMLDADFVQFSYAPRLLPEDRTPLACLAMFEDLNLLTRWRIRRETIARFILMVKKGYRNPPYHNWMHAYTVAQYCYQMVKNLKLENCLEDIEIFSLFVSCLCHDIDHRGTNNHFQTAAKSVLSALYSSEGSVLERHHFAQTMCILNTEGCNVFENLSSKDYQTVLDLVRDIILATDLQHHFKIMKNLTELSNRGYDRTLVRDRKLLTCLLMTACDLSDQTRPWNNTKKVAALIYKEFFSQGDMEKARGWQPDQMYDREKAHIPAVQIGFLDFVVLPAFRVLEKIFPPMKECADSIKNNKDHWEQISELVRIKHGGSTSHMTFDEVLALENEPLDMELTNGEN